MFIWWSFGLLPFAIGNGDVGWRLHVGSVGQGLGGVMRLWHCGMLVGLGS